jgi:hypothetical protein
MKLFQQFHLSEVQHNSKAAESSRYQQNLLSQIACARLSRDPSTLSRRHFPNAFMISLKREGRLLCEQRTPGNTRPKLFILNHEFLDLHTNNERTISVRGNVGQLGSYHLISMDCLCFNLWL